MAVTAGEALDRTARLINTDFFNDELSLEEVVEGLLGTSVTIHAIERDLSSAAGQTALTTLVTLVARLGISVELDMPPVPIIGSQPPLRGVELRAALVEHVASTIPDAAVRQHSRTRGVRLALGTAANECGPDVTAVVGTAARAVAGPAPRCEVRAWEGAWPFGALGAGGAGAAEALRSAVARIAAAAGRDLPVSCRPAGRDLVELDIGPPPSRFVDFGSIDVISAGAITHGALFSLLRTPSVTGTLRCFDDDLLEATNLNRYELMERDDIGVSKVALLERFSTDRFTVAGIPLRYTDETASTLGRLAPSVVVGADDVPTRWRVQSHRPDWLVVGATGHLLAMASTHDPNGPCVGCLHDHDDGAVLDVIPTCSVVSFWAGLEVAAAIISHAAHGADAGHAVSVYPIGLGGRHARQEYAVQANRACAVGCDASLNAASPAR